MLGLLGLAPLLAAGLGSPVAAHDGNDTQILGLVHTGDRFVPTGPHDDAFNGFKVYLSSPRHAASGNKGECRNPGYQENVNGRQWNWRAANGNFYADNYNTENHLRNLHGRGYKVHVSRNTRDNGYLENRTASRNWGAQLHIVTHTNGTTGCDTDNNYLLTLWENDADRYDDRDLANALLTTMNPDVLGPGYLRRNTGLAELETGASRGDAYVELQFHDNQRTQRWIYNNSYRRAYLYGLAVDGYLGYPS